MSDNSVVIRGDKELMRKLSKLTDLRFLRPTMKTVGQHLKEKAKSYPGGNQHRPQPFKTAKQRRFFFAALRRGDIEVPYRRGVSPGSENLSKRWHFKTDRGGTGVTLTNNASYAGLVMGPNEQTAYHAETGWKTTDQIAEEEQKTVLDTLKKAVDRELAK